MVTRLNPVKLRLLIEVHVWLDSSNANSAVLLPIVYRPTSSKVDRGSRVLLVANWHAVVFEATYMYVNEHSLACEIKHYNMDFYL